MIRSPLESAPPKIETPSSRIAAVAPAGMLDWPGNVAATVFLSGCSFACPYCHNPSLLKPYAAPGAWSQLLEHLAARREWLDGVVITGGEPTEDPGIIGLLRALRAEGWAIKLDTNGGRPEVLSTILEAGLIDALALDVKTVLGRYDALTRHPGSGYSVARSVAAIHAADVPAEFRTTAYPGAVALEEFPLIAEMLAGTGRYTIQQFNPAETLDPRASAVVPYRAEALREAASRCDSYLPTTLRGA